MDNKGIGTIHIIVGILWAAIIAIYVLILFFPVSVDITSYPGGAEVFLSSQKKGETPFKLHPIPPEGSWITIFKVEYLPHCVEYVDEMRRGIHVDLTPASDYKKIEVGVTLGNITYVHFIPDIGDSKNLTLDEHGGFFLLLNEALNSSEEDLKQFLMNCYSEKEIIINHINQ
jgi:hypothetical protein